MAFLLVLALFCLDFVVIRHAGADVTSFSGLRLIIGDAAAVAENNYQPNLSKPALAFVLIVAIGFFLSVWRPMHHHGYVFLIGMGAIASLYMVPYQLALALENADAAVETQWPFLLMVVLLVAVTCNAYLQGFKNRVASQPSKPDIHINIITTKRNKA